jgi:hypothetical protein
MDDRNGLKVSEQVGPRYAITQTTSGVADLTVRRAGQRLRLRAVHRRARRFGASMGWGDFVKIRDIGEARESEALKNAATQLAEQIDAYILGVAALAANNEVGTVGNNVATYADVLTAYTRLKKEGVDDSRPSYGSDVRRQAGSCERLSSLTPRLTVFRLRCLP